MAREDALYTFSLLVSFMSATSGRCLGRNGKVPTAPDRGLKESFPHYAENHLGKQTEGLNKPK